MDIKPRIDEDGIGWCDAGCPQAGAGGSTDIIPCQIDNRYKTVSVDVCPVWAKRMAVENAALRELLRRCLRTYNTPLYPDQTIAREIHAALDAKEEQCP